MSSTYHRRITLPRGLLRAAVVAALLLPCVLSARAGATGTTSLLISGAGDGHGVGMSQEGALGYAQHGYSYTQILAHYYTGTAIGMAPAETKVRVLMNGKIHRIPLESYVRGVVSAEMPASWPMAALEAQAVASRTYALTAHSGGAKFDVYSDARSQVYKGKVAETASTNAAVTATAGQVVTYQGSPVVTYFFASSGGRTEAVQNAFPGSSPQPWLLSVPDPYDQGPLHTWKLTISFASAAARLKGLVKGRFKGIEVLRRGSSPRILSANVLGSGGQTEVSGAELAARLGLYATWAYFSVSHSGTVTPEPDLSKHSPPAATPTPAATPAPAVQIPTTAQGGIEASPAEASATRAGAGGGTPSTTQEAGVGGGTPSG